MNKFLTLFIIAIFTGQACAINLRSNIGDLSPKHRRLSQAGQLKLKIDGRGYFMYRLRVKDVSEDSKDDESQQKSNTPGEYAQAYGNGTTPEANSARDAGLPDGAGKDGTSLEDNNFEDADSKFSQVIYSRDGSLHVNKYGFLVDDNGLLLVSSGQKEASDSITETSTPFHVHIPSRAENILVTPSGKILAEELGGSLFTHVGQLKLARFENPQGLNVRLHMRSNCAAANEDGFALGNWCAGTELDGKDHTYMAETEVSGPGIVGKPGDQGFGRIVQ